MGRSDPTLRSGCSGPNRFPLKVHVVSSKSPELRRVSGFGHRALKELRKLKRGLGAGPNLIRGGRSRKRKSRHRHVPRAGDTGRR